MLEKIKGYFNIAVKAGYVIYGADNLSTNKKMYLLIINNDASKTIKKKVAEILAVKECKVLSLSREEIKNITGKENCAIVAIKNKGIADAIIKLSQEKPDKYKEV